MKLTQNEIKQIEQVTIELKKWANNLSYNPPSTTKVQLSPIWRYKQLILLLSAKTNIGVKVEKDFAELDQLHQEYERWRGKSITEENEEELTIVFGSLKGTLYDLSETLQQIAGKARKERKRRIVKQTFYVTSAIVVFLAALFTCLGYLLGWLGPIKAFIYRILPPK